MGIYDNYDNKYDIEKYPWLLENVHKGIYNYPDGTDLTINPRNSVHVENNKGIMVPNFSTYQGALTAANEIINSSIELNRLYG